MSLLRLHPALPVLLLVLSAGCRTFEPAKFNRGAGVGEDAVLIVPFSEPRNDRWYGESERGDILAEAIKAWVRTNAEPNFPEGEDVEQVLRVVRDWQKREISSADWKKLVAQLGVKYVLSGEIVNLSLNKPGTIGILQPSVVASYRITNVSLGSPRKDFGRDDVTIEQGRGEDTDVPAFDLGLDPKVAERKLLAKLGEQIAKDLYGYYPK